MRILKLLRAQLTGDGWELISGSTGAYRMAGIRAVVLVAIPFVIWLGMSLRTRTRQRRLLITTEHHA